jgi:hypothetical protein
MWMGWMPVRSKHTLFSRIPALVMQTLPSLLYLNLSAGPDQTRSTAIIYGIVTALIVFLMLVMTGCR